MAGAARYQATHRVPHERNVLHLYRPRLHELLKQRRDGPAVLGDVQTSVVTQIYWGATEICGQPRTVGVGGIGTTPGPVELRPHQAMQKHNQTPTRVWERGS